MVLLQPHQSWLQTPQISAPASSREKVLRSTSSVPPWAPRIMPSRHQSGRYCRFGIWTESSAESSWKLPPFCRVSEAGQRSYWKRYSSLPKSAQPSEAVSKRMRRPESVTKTGMGA